MTQMEAIKLDQINEIQMVQNVLEVKLEKKGMMIPQKLGQ
jgi:hypothetical protein